MRRRDVCHLRVKRGSRFPSTSAQGKERRLQRRGSQRLLREREDLLPKQWLTDQRPRLESQRQRASVALSCASMERLCIRGTSPAVYPPLVLSSSRLATSCEDSQRERESDCLLLLFCFHPFNPLPRLILPLSSLSPSRSARIACRSRERPTCPSSFKAKGVSAYATPDGFRSVRLPPSASYL